MLLIMLIGS